MLPNIDPTNLTAGGGTPIKRPEVEQPAATSQAAAQSTSHKTTGIYLRGQDTVEINFSLSREEREAFVNAFSSKQDPATMTEEEKSTLQQASERISKYIEEAIARNSGKRERVEKAVSEWYASITKGEDQGPTDLIRLLRQAAMGQLNDQGN